MEEGLSDDPAYRAGVLMGRQQSISDVMGLLLDPDGGEADDRAKAILEWCVQTLEEGKSELALVLADLTRDDDA